ncbi:DUF659 domain-containing protein [Caenorhabditis elegans]|uniref:DUF659 domain-containing protein n=1 Tax=Caenorhabditis elegans TaxID=6239 RepID=Q8ITV5_CAEEL|nr:DUF659 domain-containing protein [Caenorhabditis elegans]CCD71677.1 DUF659 domain-containing protein [Caenorhabditis elegans]|eukprot:NP_871987.1 Uncharacterized protein CELE_Y14H12B.1 [Caenorhabditis elegans]
MSAKSRAKAASKPRHQSTPFPKTKQIPSTRLQLSDDEAPPSSPSLNLSTRSMRKRSVPIPLPEDSKEMVASRKSTQKKAKKEKTPEKEATPEPESPDDSGSEEIDNEMMEEEKQEYKFVYNIVERVPPPQTVFSVGEMGKKLLPELQAKVSLTKRKHKEDYCIACLDYKFVTGECSKAHDDNADRLQKFWKSEFPHTEPLTKAIVLADLTTIAEEWV